MITVASKLRKSRTTYEHVDCRHFPMSQQVTVANLTQDTLSCYLQHKKVRIDETASPTSLAPFISKTIPLASATARFRLFLSRKDESQVYFDVRMRSKAWKAIRTSYSIPWRIYVVRVSSFVASLRNPKILIPGTEAFRLSQGVNYT